MKPEIAQLYIFASESSGKKYQTLVYVDGTKSCECPGWIYKKKTVVGERTCKHIRWIDAGMGSQHAEKFVEYCAVAVVNIPRQRAMPSPTFKQQDLPGRERFIDLD